MPLTVINGNIFNSDLQTIVNTVNCVGVMGAGIAFECRLRFPDMYEKYIQLCENGQFEIGNLWLYKQASPVPKWVLNFPTKRHWRNPSKLEYLRIGLEKFVQSYEEKQIESIAFPTLGSLNGGLDSDESLRLMKSYLERISIPVEIYIHDKTAKDDLYEVVKSSVIHHDNATLSRECGIQSIRIEKLRLAFERDDICQLNQLSRIKGIGTSTLAKVFKFATSRETVLQQSLNLT